MAPLVEKFTPESRATIARVFLSIPSSLLTAYNIVLCYSRDTITTFLEANGRGYWDTSEENIELLQDLYQEVEDKIEGV